MARLLGADRKAAVTQTLTSPCCASEGDSLLSPWKKKENWEFCIMLIITQIGCFLENTNKCILFYLGTSLSGKPHGKRTFSYFSCFYKHVLGCLVCLSQCSWCRLAVPLTLYPQSSPPPLHHVQSHVPHQHQQRHRWTRHHMERGSVAAGWQLQGKDHRQISLQRNVSVVSY